MKFTVTTSFYNGEQYIDRLYQSLKNQTYTNWEWVVTDDWSQDNAKEKLIELASKDRKVKYVEQSKKKEMFWNPQVFCPNAEIIVQLDVDDLIHAKALEVYAHFFTKFPDVIAINCAQTHIMRPDGGWDCYICIDYRKDNNMSAGQMVFLRAWRNNPNIKLDFNPNDWMNYFYNDLSMMCVLEEHGKILNLHRTLYSYTRRKDSISHSESDDLPAVRKENADLMAMIKSRRDNDNLDTLERYFYPVQDLASLFVDQDFGCMDTQQKVSLISTEKSAYKKKLLKELYFDHDINFNLVSPDVDWYFFRVESWEDYELLEKYFDEAANTQKELCIQVIVASSDNLDIISRNGAPNYPPEYGPLREKVSEFIRERFYHTYHDMSHYILKVYGDEIKAKLSKNLFR